MAYKRAGWVVLAIVVAACTTPQPEPSGVYTKPGVSPEQARAATLACDAAGKQKFPSRTSEAYFMRMEAAQASYQCMTAQGYVRVK